MLNKQQQQQSSNKTAEGARERTPEKIEEMEATPNPQTQTTDETTNSAAGNESTDPEENEIKEREQRIRHREEAKLIIESD